MVKRCCMLNIMIETEKQYETNKKWHKNFLGFIEQLENTSDEILDPESKALLMSTYKNLAFELAEEMNDYEERKWGKRIPYIDFREELKEDGKL